MKRSWIGSLASLTLGLICAVALSTAPFGCSQNKGSVTQTKSSAERPEATSTCPKDCPKSCCAKAAGTCPKDCPKATGECPKDCPKACCAKAAGTCHKDCPKATGKCPHADKKPCPCTKTEGK